VGDRWRRMWLERLNGVHPMIEPWLRHQHRDAYWRHGSVCEDYAAIDCPVMVVGGWSDGYRDAVLRLLEGLSVPRRGLIGPWSHHYPHEPAAPGPAIGFLQECLRWWDEWLRGRATGVRDEPMLLAWMQEPAAPSTFYAQRPGRWVAEPVWPAAAGSLSLTLGREGTAAGQGDRLDTVSVGESVGIEGGFWCPFGHVGDWAPDQRDDPHHSLCYTTAPLTERLELLGRPRLGLRVMADRPLAQLAVRLNAVSGDGSATLLTRGMLNLAHRDSHTQPSPLEPGRFYDLTVTLQSLGQAVAAGQRLRVAISPGYWPWLWPSPERATLTIDASAGLTLELPRRTPRPDGAAPCADPLAAPPLPHRITRSASGARQLARDGELVRMTHHPHDFRLEMGGGAVVDWSGPDVYTLVESDPLSASIESERRVQMTREGWDAEVRIASSMRCDGQAFAVETRLQAASGAERLASREWRFRIPRDLV
jgi:predicted acyl esterase